MNSSAHFEASPKAETHSLERQQAAHRSTMVSVVVNIVLVVLQIAVGLWARSQSLVADGLHSLSDLVADFVVLFVNKFSHAGADERHPYGHARFETAASLLLGVLLFVAGVGMLWSAGSKIQHPETIANVHVVALWVALLTLVAKEGLFRYMLKIAERVKSGMLIANAWHARSDAASSLVVAGGIIGNLAGYPFLDPLAAALVGFMIARTGWKFTWQALSDLMDESLDDTEVNAIRATLAETAGVKDVHDLRTRKMGDLALVDAHVLVDSYVSVSEGHHIAALARRRVMENHAVLDVLVHVDPEDDHGHASSISLPSRDVLEQHFEQALGPALSSHVQLQMHYLNGKIELDIVMRAEFNQLSVQERERLLQALHECTQTLGQLGISQFRHLVPAESPALLRE